MSLLYWITLLCSKSFCYRCGEKLKYKIDIRKITYDRDSYIKRLQLTGHFFSVVPEYETAFSPALVCKHCNVVFLPNAIQRIKKKQKNLGTVKIFGYDLPVIQKSRLLEAHGCFDACVEAPQPSKTQYDIVPTEPKSKYFQEVFGHCHAEENSANELL